MQANVQNSTRTTLPRRALIVSGPVLIHAVIPSKSGAGPRSSSLTDAGSVPANGVGRDGLEEMPAAVRGDPEADDEVTTGSSRAMATCSIPVRAVPHPGGRMLATLFSTRTSQPTMHEERGHDHEAPDDSPGTKPMRPARRGPEPAPEHRDRQQWQARTGHIGESDRRRGEGWATRDGDGDDRRHDRSGTGRPEESDRRPEHQPGEQAVPSRTNAERRQPEAQIGERRRGALNGMPQDRDRERRACNSKDDRGAESQRGRRQSGCRQERGQQHRDEDERRPEIRRRRPPRAIDHRWRSCQRRVGQRAACTARGSSGRPRGTRTPG